MIWLSALLISLTWAGDLSLISIPTAETTGYPGSPLLLSVQGRSESGAEIRYQWKKDGRDLKGETGNTLIVKKAAAKDAGVYSVAVSTDTESKSAETKVKMSKTKLPKQARVPASNLPAAPSCHESSPAPKAASKAEDHSHHHVHH